MLLSLVVVTKRCCYKRFSSYNLLVQTYRIYRCFDAENETPQQTKP